MTKTEVQICEIDERTYYSINKGHIIVLDMNLGDVKESLRQSFEKDYLIFSIDPTLKEIYLKKNKNVA
jgi:hypothetical protein